MVAMHIAYALDLIAVILGASLLVFSIKHPGKGSWFGRVSGGAVMILAVISILCMFSCAFKGGECHEEGLGHGEHMKPMEHEHMGLGKTQVLPQ